MRKQQEEERLQRRVQEEAVKFLWKQVGVKMRNTANVKPLLSDVFSWEIKETRVIFIVVFVDQLQVVLEWQSSVNERLSSASDPSIPSETPVQTEISILESGFHSPGERPAALDNSLSSTAGSPETVRSLGPLRAGAGDSLLEQYLCSVQRQDEEEDEDKAAGTPSHLPPREKQQLLS